MPEQFVSYNPTQVGQGNNIVYQPVNQQYGQLFAQGLGRVAAQKAKAAKDAQEKEYKFKAPNIGSSAYIPNKVTGALENFNKKYTSMPGFSTSVDLQNQAALEGNQLKTDVAQLALGEEGYKKFDNDIINSTDPRLAKYPSIIGAQEKLKDLYKFIEEEEAKVTDPTQKDAAAVRAAAIWHAQKRNAPRKLIKTPLNEALQGVDPYSKVGSDGSTLADANKPGFYVQQGTEKKYITEDNLNNVITSTQNNNAVLNHYIDNDFAKAGEEIYSKEDADNFVVENYYTDPKKKLDENRFATDDKYRNEVIEESYKKQKDAMKEQIRRDVLSKYGVTEEGLNELKNKTNIIQKPGASNIGKEEEQMKPSVTTNGTILYDPNLNQNMVSAPASVTYGKEGISQNINPFSDTGSTIYTENGVRTTSGSAKSRITDQHKVYMLSDLSANKNVPLIVYKETKDANGKPVNVRIFGDINKIIEEGLYKYKIVNPNHAYNPKGGEFDPKNNLISFDDFKKQFPNWSVEPGIATTYTNADKFNTTGTRNENTTAPLNNVQSVVGYTPQRNIKNSPVFKSITATKIGGKPIAKINDAGDFELIGEDLWNNTKLRSVDKTTGKFRASSGSVNEGAFGKYKGKSKR